MGIKERPVAVVATGLRCFFGAVGLLVFNLGVILEDYGCLPVRADVDSLAEGKESGGVEFACVVEVGEGASVVGELGFDSFAPFDLCLGGVVGINR